MSLDTPHESGVSKPGPLSPELFVKSIVQINEKLVQGLSYEQILDSVFVLLKQFIPFDRLGIALIDAQKEALILRWVKSTYPAAHIREHYFALLAGSSLDTLIKSGKPRIINDLLAYQKSYPESRHTALIVKDGIRSNFAGPLRVSGRTIGVVFFSSLTPQTYREEHVSIYQSIANELAIIIDYGKLLKFFERSLSATNTVQRCLHDLKSPLAMITGYLDLAIEEPSLQALAPALRKFIKTAKNNAAHMSLLLNDVSDILMNSTSHQTQLQSVILRPFLAEVIASARFLAGPKGIRIVLELNPSVPVSACFDPYEIRRVLDNLLSNAVKFSLPATQVTLLVDTLPDRLVFAVRDEGLGIPEGELPDLFQEFKSTSTRPTGGERSTGLGLAIVKKFVEDHGGQIGVESAVGKGSVFTFTLPCHEAEAATSSPATPH